ncbi:hypothetical protein L0244_27490 [bacterium]|nr:hypothetical protein [bacterium]
MLLTLIGGALGLSVTLSTRKLLLAAASNYPETFTAISILILSVVLIASYFPARRAARLSPLNALRYE